MSSIDNFLSEVYSEELYQFTEAEYDEVMSAPAVDDDWQGYEEWSEEVEASLFSEGDLENFETVNGKVYHKPQPPQRERVGSIEI